jgi:hypothetical protein
MRLKQKIMKESLIEKNYRLLGELINKDVYERGDKEAVVALTNMLQKDLKNAIYKQQKASQ